MIHSLFLIVCVAASVVASSSPTQWALLVAGSKGIFNYRHQSDVAHAFHVVKGFGIPESNIVTMLYDDVAHDGGNPFPGTLFNRPNGTNLYEGLVKDYVKEDVTPENFLKILTGDVEGMKTIGSGKVIESGASDHIFVYFSDHGAEEALMFPDGVLHASTLNQTLWRMHENKQFHKMVIYVEACNSGSMFDTSLPDDIEVLAVTAANRVQSSWACFWDEKVYNYLGDCFSILWMEDRERGLGASTSIMDQFRFVKPRVKYSEVSMFGDVKIADDKIDQFEGPNDGESERGWTLEANSLFEGAVAAPDVPVVVATKRLAAASTPEKRREARKELDRLVAMRGRVDDVFQGIVEHVTTTNSKLGSRLSSFASPFTENVVLGSGRPCYESSVEAFHKGCFNLGRNGYPTTKLKVLANLCELGATADEIAEAVTTCCSLGPWEGAD